MSKLSATRTTGAIHRPRLCGAGVLYYCPSYGDYDPNVPSCPDPWIPEAAS
jgi:hypothetical protein